MLIETLNNANSIVSLLEFVSKKLGDDNKVFKNQLRKNITFICETAMASFDESPELKDVIPSYVDDVIFEEVISALVSHPSNNQREVG